MRSLLLSSVLAVAGVFVPQAAAQDGTPDSADAAKSAIAAAIAQHMPATRIESIRESAIPGLYEVVAGPNVFYTGPDGRYLVVGSIYDLRAGRDLTADRREAVNRMVWEELPLDAAVRHGDGGSRRLAIFSDPNCPHCRRLYQEVRQLRNVSVHEILFPLSGQPTEETVAVLCADKPGHALGASYRDQLVVSAVGESCRAKAEAAIRGAIAYGREHGVRGTPTIVRADGRRYTGPRTAAQLDEWLSEETQP